MRAALKIAVPKARPPSVGELSWPESYARGERNRRDHLAAFLGVCRRVDSLEDLRELPTDGDSGVYLCVRGGVLEYVGQTRSFFERVKQHKKWFELGGECSIWILPIASSTYVRHAWRTGDSKRHLEAALIWFFRPLRNRPRKGRIYPDIETGIIALWLPSIGGES